MPLDPPANPVGPYVPIADWSRDQRDMLIDQVAAVAPTLREAVRGLSEQQRDLKYRNWSIRQIVHHLADSHMHSYIRFKWALTESTPTIKPYHEGLWSDLRDAQTADIEPSLQLLEALHVRWVTLLRGLTEEEFQRAFHNPESGKTLSLNAALSYYAWHGRHHMGQIVWLRQHGPV